MRLLKCLVILPLFAAHCHKNVLDDPETPTVKLLAKLNDTSAVMHLGDTLKINLQVPDTVILISKVLGTSTSQLVNSVKTCMYNFNLSKLDTTTRILHRITSTSQMFVSPGKLMWSGSVYSTTTKPYVSELNLVPESKGLYCIDFGLQETMLQYNSDGYAGLRVNINSPDKHLYFFEPFFPGITNSCLLNYENEGFAYYVFKVI